MRRADARPATLLVYALLLGAAIGYVTSDLFDPVVGVILGVLAFLALLGSVRHPTPHGSVLIPMRTRSCGTPCHDSGTLKLAPRAAL